LVKASITYSRLTHIDASTAVAATAFSGAVAAMAFAQTGRDLFNGVADVADRALAAIEEDRVLFGNVDQAHGFPARLRSAISWLKLPGAEVMEQVLMDPIAEGPDWVLAAMALAGNVAEEPYQQIEEGARLGGSTLGTMVGALVGARIGIRAWPWMIPNDTWFAEIGRRLVSANRETRDIPVPYHVEETLTYGMEPDSRERFRLP
jgi:ADP-ribosylglycohydrolase